MCLERCKKILSHLLPSRGAGEVGLPEYQAPLAAQRWVPTGWGPTSWPTLRDKPAGRVALPIPFA